MRFKIDWASLIVGSKFTVFGLFYSVLEDNFPSISPRGDLTEGFLRYRFWGAYIGGAYSITWRGLFSEFYGSIAFICFSVILDNLQHLFLWQKRVSSISLTLFLLPFSW